MYSGHRRAMNKSGRKLGEGLKKMRKSVETILSQNLEKVNFIKNVYGVKCV